MKPGLTADGRSVNYADCYLAKDPSDPTKVAVMQWVANGRHPVIEPGFETGSAARRWLATKTESAKAPEVDGG